MYLAAPSSGIHVGQLHPSGVNYDAMAEMEESLLLTKDQDAEERAFREVRYDAIHCQSLSLNYIWQSSYF